MNFRVVVVVSLFLAVHAGAASLPGIRFEPIAQAADFVSSVAVDSRGTIYYTGLSGGIYRLDGSQSVQVAHVTTEALSDSGLLGMALVDDTTAAVHYTNVAVTREHISKIDLVTGVETQLAEFVSDVTSADRAVSGEHHGGNPTVAPDGSIFFAIGDYGTLAIAADPAWNAGKIWRVYPDGRTEQWVRGVRNVFDLAWDDERQRLVFADNGPVQGDEINIAVKGDHCGWPTTWGGRSSVPGMVDPLYVFDKTIAPTGVLKLSGRNQWLRGYLFAGFMVAAVYLVPDIDARPLPEPLPLTVRDAKLVIDVAEMPNGDIVFATFDSIERLVLPRRGDCDGNGEVDRDDIAALEDELRDGRTQSIVSVNAGAHAGSFGCDASGDRIVDDSDRAAMFRLVGGRARAMRLR